MRESASGDGRKDNARISKLTSLDRRLEDVYENIHPDFRSTTSAALANAKCDPYRLFGLHAIYHLCACALHSSIVPVFSGASPDPHISKKQTRLSAEESVKHSIMLADMATTFTSIYIDKSRISSFTGYALFVSCNIQFKARVAQGRLRSHGTSRLNAAISIIEELKDYWQPQGSIVSISELRCLNIR